MHPIRFVFFIFCSALLSISSKSAHAQFNIVINPGVNLQTNQAALDAFERAAASWESVFTDNITVNIDADFFGFAAAGLGGPGVIGQASSNTIAVDYDTLRGELVADGIADNDGITAFLPTAAQLGANFLPGAVFTGDIRVNTANLKAIDEDNSLGLNNSSFSDGLIEFNSDFNFDFNNLDGVVGADFETVAAHEIGHVLGFVSELDQVEANFLNSPLGVVFAADIAPLDLFRFDDVDIPTNLTEFTLNDRSLVSGRAASFSDTVDTFGLSTGEILGDGNQASHFLDDAITGTTIGILDPTLPLNQATDISSADIRVFDLIGFNVGTVAVPEPGTATILAAFAVALFSRRPRKPC